MHALTIDRACMDRQSVSFCNPIQFMGVVNFNSCKFELLLPHKKIAIIIAQFLRPTSRREATGLVTSISI